MSYRKSSNTFNTSVVKRFEDKYVPEPNSGCWLWVGATNQDGYGRFSFKGKLIGAHRFSLMLYKEEENRFLCVCHTCDNTYCVNPNHLFFATHAENMLDKKKKGRVGYNPARGAQHYMSKLRESDITEIRWMRLQGTSYSKIARIYNVSNESIRKIILGVSWRHV